MLRADRLVATCLRIIQQLQPNVWFLEIHDSGLLKRGRSCKNCPTLSLITACMARFIERVRGFGAMPIGGPSCAIDRTSLTGSTLRRPEEAGEGLERRRQVYIGRVAQAAGGIL